MRVNPQVKVPGMVAGMIGGILTVEPVVEFESEFVAHVRRGSLGLRLEAVLQGHRLALPQCLVGGLDDLFKGGGRLRGEVAVTPEVGGDHG